MHRRVRGRVIGELLGCWLLFGGCNEPSPPAASISGTPVPIVDETAPVVPECQSDSDCDDHKACTIDACHDGQCVTRSIITSQACRPSIEITQPQRAATIQQRQSEITVSGRIDAPVGPIVAATLNDRSLELQPNGSFSATIPTAFGTNVFTVAVTDDHGQQREHTQSFLWAPKFVKPTPRRPLDDAILMSVGQTALDGIARQLTAILNALDLAQFVKTPRTLGSGRGYAIELTQLSTRTTTAQIKAIDHGLAIDLTIRDLGGALRFDCRSTACRLIGGDSTGGFRIPTVTVRSIATIDLQHHRLSVGLREIETSLSGLEVHSNKPWTNMLIQLVEPMVRQTVVDRLERHLTQQLKTKVPSLLSSGLASLQLQASLDLPRSPTRRSDVQLQLTSDFARIALHDGRAPPQPSPRRGLELALRGSAQLNHVSVDTHSRGIPLRSGCPAEPKSLPNRAPIELGLSDNALNTLLYSGWQAGLLEFPATTSVPLGHASFTVRGLSPPTVSDCSGELKVTLGDVRIDGSVTTLGTKTHFRVFATLALPLTFRTVDAGIEVWVDHVDDLWLDVQTTDDASISREGTIRMLLEQTLPSALIRALHGGKLATLSVPTIDLGSRVGLPPGHHMLGVQLDAIQRQPGRTTIGAHLSP